VRDTASNASAGPETGQLPELWRLWSQFFPGLPGPRFGVTRDNAQDILDGAQIGLINLTTGVSRDPALEHRIVTEVAGYGRQLGRIMEALDVLARRTLLEGDLADQDRVALTDLRELAGEITAARRANVEERRDKIVADVAMLCGHPAQNAEVLARLRQVLDEAKPRT
jgi:hypothetical protein